MNGKNRQILLMAVLGLLALVSYNFFSTPQNHGRALPIPYSEFLKSVSNGDVRKVIIRGNMVHGETETNQVLVTQNPDDPKLVERLLEKDVVVMSGPAEDSGFSFWQVLISWMPMLLFIGVWVFYIRQMQSSGNKAMGFGKSRARLMNENTQKVTFKDVAGVDEAREQVEEIVDFLKDPQKFLKLGAKIPRGVLLMGSPGTGKTLLARAIAGEADVPFFSISGSDFVEMFVGVGASRVRDLFEQGKKNAPCIIFIDEIDAVGRHRGSGVGGGNDEREQTLNQMLVEMDGFNGNEGVIIIAATNRPDVLDPALVRPGRFDRQVVVSLPDIKGREAILNVHMQKVPISHEVDNDVLARGTPGFSGADLANLINEAALIAARQNKRVVNMEDFEEAKDKILMGPERRTMVMSDEEKKTTAYHEAGHAIAAYYSPGCDPIHKATIIPRGRALGMVMTLPEKDQISKTRQQFLSNMVLAMGGRAAEEIVFGYDNVTSGAYSDIKGATDSARAMVKYLGLSDAIGPINYENENLSPETSRLIDHEVKTLVQGALDQAKQLLNDKREQLNALAEMLLEHETLTGEEIGGILRGEPWKERKSPSESLVKPKTSSVKKTSTSTRKKPTHKKNDES